MTTPTPEMAQAFIEAYNAERDYWLMTIKAAAISLETHEVRLASIKLDQANAQTLHEIQEGNRRLMDLEERRRTAELELSELTLHRAMPDSVYVNSVKDIVTWLKRANDDDRKIVRYALQQLSR